MKVPVNRISILLALSLGLFLLGCTQKQSLDITASSIEDIDENIDTSCAYFYFLWGNNAEYSERYDEALEAYEKASICDPKAEYISEKIPVLLIHLGRLQDATVWLENYIRKKPYKTVQRFMLARLKIQEGKEEEAIELYNEALKLEPENDNIRLRLGLLYSKEEKSDKAEKIFKTILKKNKSSYFSILYLARLYVKTGELKLAEKHYLDALSLNWSRELSFEVADFYSLRKQFSKAGEVYIDILNRDETDEQAAFGLVQNFLFMGDGENALTELQRMRQFTTNPIRIDIVRAQILLNSGKLEEAEAILTSIIDIQDHSQASYLLGVIYFEQEQSEKALSVLHKVEKQAKEFVDAVILQVRIFEEQKKSTKSIELLQQVITETDKPKAIYYSLLGSILQQQKRTDEAFDILELGTERFSDDPSLLYDFGILLEKRKEHNRAMLQMKKVLEINAKHADALNFIGYSWADRGINLEKAYDYIKKALEIKPNSGYILDSLGWVYFRLEKYDKALVELEKAYSLIPQDPYISDHLGDTYKALNNKEKALYYYNKALELASDEKILQSIRQKIHRLENL